MKTSVVDNESSGADGTVEFALGFPVKRKKTKPPLALHIHGLNHSSAVRTVPRRRLPRQNPLVLVAHKHQAHLPLLLSINLSDHPLEKDFREYSNSIVCLFPEKIEFVDCF